MTNLMLALGLNISAATLVSLIWSIAYPDKRLWPPQRYTWSTPWLVWTPTALLTLSLIGLGCQRRLNFDPPRRFKSDPPGLWEGRDTWSLHIAQADPGLVVQRG